MITDDMELVEQYARHQSESAFSALVSRHADLVYSAALRIVGEPHLAEEVTQAVFLILAQKAGSLGEKTILPSWLYRAACFTALNARNKEQRRQQREQEAYMQALPDENPTEAAWENIAPLLEEAMLQLGQADRDALVLRYFEDRTLNEVGLVLGASEDAAKKRVNRALEKLRKFLTKRGVVSTSALIAAAISANSVQAAPVSLTNTLAAVAIAKGAGAGSSTLTLAKGALKLMAWAKAKTAIVVGLGLVLAAGTISESLPLFKKEPIDPDSKVPVKVTVRMKDGSKFPPYVVVDGGKLHFWVNGVFRPMKRSGAFTSYNRTSETGVFTNAVERWDLFFSAWAETFAPAVIGPINLLDKTSVNLDLALEPGFSTTVHVFDSDTGAPINNASVTLEFLNKWGNAECAFCTRSMTTDGNGLGRLEHCSDLVANIGVALAGYETTTKRVESLHPEERIEIPVRQALVTRGTVFDKRTGKPIAGAGIYSVNDVWDVYNPITVADAEGRFQLDQLPRDIANRFLASATGFSRALLFDVRAGQTNLEVYLGPEMPVRGTITGRALTNKNSSVVAYVEAGGFNRLGHEIPLSITWGGTGFFSFTNPVPGNLTLEVGGEKFTRYITTVIPLKHVEYQLVA